MNEKQKATCASCRFVNAEQTDKTKPPDFVCRRFPPTLMAMPIPEPDLAGGMKVHFRQRASAWPYVRESSWCGEHQPGIPGAIKLS
jgi:hypothetical protein